MLSVQGILSKLVAFINSLPVYWLILRLVNPATVSGESCVEIFCCLPENGSTGYHIFWGKLVFSETLAN